MFNQFEINSDNGVYGGGSPIVEVSAFGEIEYSANVYQQDGRFTYEYQDGQGDGATEIQPLRFAISGDAQRDKMQIPWAISSRPTIILLMISTGFCLHGKYRQPSELEGWGFENGASDPTYYDIVL